MTFVLAFLGALFALFVVVALVWTYAVLSVLPRLAKWYGDEMAKAAGGAGQFPMQLPPGYVPQDARSLIVHTCEVHGRCDGCRWVLEHMETVAIVPGFELNDIEMDELVRLRAEFKGESLVVSTATVLPLPTTVGNVGLTYSQVNTLLASVSTLIADLMAEDDPNASIQAHLRNAREIERLLLAEVIRRDAAYEGVRTPRREDARG